MADEDASIEVDMLAQSASVDVEMRAHDNVEDADDAQGGSTSEVELIVASADRANGEIDPDSMTMRFDPPSISSQEGSVPFSALGEVLHEKAVKKNGLAVIVPPVQNRWEYKVFKDEEEVDEILEEYDDAGFVEYLVLFADGSEDVVSSFSGLPFLQHMLPRLPPRSPSILMLDSFYIITCFLFHYSTCPSTQSSTCHPTHPLWAWSSRYLSTRPAIHFHPHTLQSILIPHLFTSPTPNPFS